MSGFQAFASTCISRRVLRVERRPGNALNVEIGSPMPRCMLQPPDGRGVTKDGSTMDWIRSGGQELDYLPCDPETCPKAREWARQERPDKA